MHVHIYAHTLIFMSCGCTHDINHAYKHPEMHVYIHNTYTCMTLHIGMLQIGTYVCAHTMHKIMQQGTLNTHHTHRYPAHTSTLHALACTSATDTWRPQHQCVHTQGISHIYVYAHMYTPTQGSNAQIRTHMQTSRHAHMHTHGRHALAHIRLELGKFPEPLFLFL